MEVVTKPSGCIATVSGGRKLSTDCLATPVCPTCGRCDRHCRCSLPQADGDRGEPMAGTGLEAVTAARQAFLRRERRRPGPDVPLHY